MTLRFLAIRKSDLSDGDAAGGYRVCFSTLPSGAQHPTVWLDLRIFGGFHLTFAAALGVFLGAWLVSQFGVSRS